MILLLKHLLHRCAHAHTRVHLSLAPCVSRARAHFPSSLHHSALLPSHVHVILPWTGGLVGNARGSQSSLTAHCGIIPFKVRKNTHTPRRRDLDYWSLSVYLIEGKWAQFCVNLAFTAHPKNAWKWRMFEGCSPRCITVLVTVSLWPPAPLPRKKNQNSGRSPPFVSKTFAAIQHSFFFSIFNHARVISGKKLEAAG